VQADPRAAGSMDLLKKGRGGFQVEEKPVPAEAAPPAETHPRVTRIFQWVDATGRTQISDQPPPRGTAGVKVFD